MVNCLFALADKYRVILNGECPDYIHAVYVNVRIIAMMYSMQYHSNCYCIQGYNKQKAYIIGESPMKSTVRKMYKIVSDNKCGAIIMLSTLSENSKVRNFRLSITVYFVSKFVQAFQTRVGLAFLELIHFALNVGMLFSILASSNQRKNGYI